MLIPLRFPNLVQIGYYATLYGLDSHFTQLYTIAILLTKKSAFYYFANCIV